MKNIQLRDTRGKIIFEYEKVDNTIKDTLEEAAKQRVNLSHVNLPKVNLRGLDLARKEIGVDLSHANFSGSDMTFSRLQNAYLTNTKFIYTNLSYASLHGTKTDFTNFRGAVLDGTSLDKRYIQVSQIGALRGSIIYCFDDDVIWSDGGFTGSLDDFEKLLEESFKSNVSENKKYQKEYKNFINYINSLK